MALTLDSDPRGPTWKAEQTQYTLFSDLQSYTVAYTCMHAHTHTCINKHRKVESNYQDIKTDLWCLQLSAHMNVYIYTRSTYTVRLPAKHLFRFCKFENSILFLKFAFLGLMLNFFSYFFSTILFLSFFFLHFI